MRVARKIGSVLWLAAMICTVILPQSASAQADKVVLTFYTLTATHAAFGAPMQYQLTLTNTGTTAVMVNSQVNLISPNGTTFTLLSTNPTLQPGQVLGTPGTFTTSTLTSQTGNFTLQGQFLSGGVVIQKIVNIEV